MRIKKATGLFTCIIPLLLSVQAVQVPALAQATGSQPASSSLEFAVASVRPNPKPTYMRLEFTVDGFLGEGVTLHQLIMMAYNIPEYDRLLGEPAWVDSDYFDVKAKIDDSLAATFSKLSMDERDQMLQRLLADRFGLVAHREVVERPVYDLVIGPGGPKLEVTKPGDLNLTEVNGVRGLITRMDRGHLQVQGYSMDSFASLLGAEWFVDRTVVNRTGLSGFYSFSLHWVPEDLPGHANSSQNNSESGPIPSDPVGGSTIFVEIQKQLGLRLQSSKGPVTMIAVDRVQQPAPN
jgi:uncharacterized protein (TIGR03435 family)